jgi:hypothetical protein
MRAKLYVETSVISYLTARPSRDAIALGHQELTRDWWNRARMEFELFASRLVVAEAQVGDPDAAAARLAVLEPIALLTETPDSRTLAHRLVAAGGLPAKAGSDALHRDRRRPRHGLSSYVELSTYRQRTHDAIRHGDLPIRRLRAAGHLHTGRACGGVTMWEDPIVKETRAAREELLERFDYDLDALCAYLETIELPGGKEPVTLDPKPFSRRRKSS